MGQEYSVYTDNMPNIAITPNARNLLPRIAQLRSPFRLGKEGLDLERELKKWLNLGKDNTNVNNDDEEEEDVDDEDNDNDEEDDDVSDDDDTDKDEKEIKRRSSTHVTVYKHSRTSIGSPSINRNSFTEEEMTKFKVENDGFPLPSTEAELSEFDRQVFIENSEKTTRRKRTKKRDRQRSKSATAVPDFGTIRLKLQKLQTPGKPKFIEHLINRVVSKKVNKRDSNDTIENNEENPDLPEEPLSPDSEKCLQQAEALVEELLTCSIRPASSESEDSGKGSSLLESTSDFSPTSKRKSWSTPASPTALHGIVKERLRSFQALQETSDTESVTSPSASHSPLQKQKSFKSEEFELELQEINRNIKQFYCSESEDEHFNSAVMDRGYVKALVARINENKLTESEGDHENEASVGDDKVENSNGIISNDNVDEINGDSGWDEWEKEVGDSEENGEVENVEVGNEEEENGDNSESDKVSRRSSKNSVCSSVSLRSKTSTPVASPRTSNCSARSSSSHESSVNRSRASSSSDNDNQDEDVKPRDKLHQIAHELLQTERAYVARLHLLDQVFHFRVAMENKNGNFLPPEAVTSMFSNIKPIYMFHNDFLLPQLETRMQNWTNEQKIGDIMAKLAPFLKIYTEYVKNYDNAMSMIDKCVSQYPKFAALLQEIQLSPECGQLTLQHHMLEPIQRVPRYELLLKDYLKRLEPDAIDRPDAQKALDLVSSAASHSNTAMKKLDKFNKLLNIIPRLNGETNDLISPTRELIKEGPITKISARSGEKQARYIFLFNDLLLVCSEQIMGSYKLRARLKVEGMEILAGDNQIIQNTFCVKCVEKTVEFLDEANNGNGLDWFATFQQVKAESVNKSKLCRVRSSDSGDQSGFESSLEMSKITGGLTSMMSSLLSLATGSTSHKLSTTQLGQKSPYWTKDEEVTMCMACQDRFTALKRRHHCRACGKVFCAKCSSKKAALQYDNNQLNRVCHACYDALKGVPGSSDSTDTSFPLSPKPITQTKADEVSVLSGYLHVMDKDKKWLRRWVSARNDFALYFYKKNKDVAAIQTLPLPGHKVKALETSDKTNVFTLTHKDITVCNFQADSEAQFHQWLQILQKMVLLELPTEEDKRLSTHSNSSNQSNSSGVSSQS